MHRCHGIVSVYHEVQTTVTEAVPLQVVCAPYHVLCPNSNSNSCCSLLLHPTLPCSLLPSCIPSRMHSLTPSFLYPPPLFSQLSPHPSFPLTLARFCSVLCSLMCRHLIIQDRAGGYSGNALCTNGAAISPLDDLDDPPPYSEFQVSPQLLARDALEGGGDPPHPSRALSLCPATVSLTPSARLNGICTRQPPNRFGNLLPPPV